jgi:hypothetical protein
MIDDKFAQSYLDSLEDKIINEADKKPIILTSEWTTEFPSKPGIYAIFEGVELIWVGETGNIQSRMMDLLDSRHHVLRRHIGQKKFSSEPDFQKATTKNKFPPPIERKLEKWLMGNCKIAAMPVLLGRKELEERIVDTRHPKYNLRAQRGR